MSLQDNLVPKSDAMFAAVIVTVYNSIHHKN